MYKSKKNIPLTKALIIFIKNPQAGKVKTRIAATLGNEKALEIYGKLLEITRKMALKINADKHLFYGLFIPEKDNWSENDFKKKIQSQSLDLGVRMMDAFMQMKNLGYEKALIIGSDCPDLKPEIINDAFDNLAETPAVIGPALDGGYYSIGFNFKILGERAKPILENVFLNKTWSHENVAKEAKAALAETKTAFLEMPALNDADTEADVAHLL